MIDFQCLELFAKNQILTRIIMLLKVEGACTKYRIIPKSCDSFSAITDVLCIAANLIHICVIENTVMEKFRVEVVVSTNYAVVIFKIGKGSPNRKIYGVLANSGDRSQTCFQWHSSNNEREEVTEIQHSDHRIHLLIWGSLKRGC